MSVDTLRYYERVGVIPSIKRNESSYPKFKTGELESDNVKKLW